MKQLFKGIICFVLVASLCICGAGCVGKTQNENPEISTGGTEPSVSGTEPSQETVSEETTAPAEPVDISTTGGVVVVGTVCHDDSGWYLKPQQPLNIEFHYFLNNPSQFDGLLRIELFDPKIDGIEKLLYLGETVTIEGAFRFYRDNFEKVYLSPYRIHIGKTVSESYAAPDLVPPDLTVNRYDPSVPLPARMDKTVLDGRYVYNPYMLSLETLERMGNDFAAFYCDFVDAFLNYKGDCPCPSEEFAKMLSTVIYYEFPLYDVCAQPFEFVKHYNSVEEKVTISYKYDQATHQQKIDTFMDVANAYLATTSATQSQAELAKNIYHELCTRVTYDDSALTEFERKNAYYAYVNYSGVCVTFAIVYNQLLTQVGIQTTTAYCDYTPTMGHMWSLITIDGKQYFCDPTFELNYDGGAGYRYFGQTYEQRLENGMGAAGITAGRYGVYSVDKSMLSSVPLSF